MGRVKEWALNRPCIVCGYEAESLSEDPICSDKCQAEYDQVLNAIADEQEAQLELDLNYQKVADK
jgi:endogenous inhibitor of DNA gyrase (YacG/DUF329 family)